MLNFAVGPVMMSPEIRRIGAEEIPYFRTPEFSRLMKENEEMMCRLMQAPEGSRAVFLTGSGTAAMEAAVMNMFTKEDRVLVVNGGSFGARFAKLCRIHHIPYEELCPERGTPVTREDLDHAAGSGFTGLLINIDETSTGVLYDMKMVGDFCREHGICLVADAVSSFLTDEFRMEEWGADLALTGSQKALALPPGLSILTLSPAGVRRVMSHEVESLYFDLKDYLINGERGQTPYTPAVSVLLQLHERLSEILSRGLSAELASAKAQAEDFRERIKDLPLEIVSSSLSNAVTPLHPTGHYADGSPVSARKVFEVLKDEYDIFVCPNGGELEHLVFRVGHIGNLTPEDNETLVRAFRDLVRRGLL